MAGQDSQLRGQLIRRECYPISTEVKHGEEIIQIEVSEVCDANGNDSGPMLSWRVITEEQHRVEQSRMTTNELVTCAEELRISAKDLLAGSEGAMRLAETTTQASSEVEMGISSDSSATDQMQETMQATSSIDEQVRDISAQTEEAANRIREISSIVSEIFDLASTLASSVEERDITTRRIADAVRLAADRAASISREMVGMTEAATTSNQTAHAMIGAAEQLRSLATSVADAA